MTFVGSYIYVKSSSVSWHSRRGQHILQVAKPLVMDSFVARISKLAALELMFPLFSRSFSFLGPLLWSDLKCDGPAVAGQKMSQNEWEHLLSNFAL